LRLGGENNLISGKIGKEITIGDGQVGFLTKRLFKKITDIQYGHAEDPYGWIEPV